jgi:3-hydroxyisobutyrate dehydrogenase-like beta-hydroxyacid dehydrogenase
MIPISIIHADSVNKGMCKNIVTRGDLENPLIIFNRTAKRAEDLSKSLPSGKSVVSTSIDEVVSKSDIIFICVSDDAAVNENIDTALKSDVKGKLFVDCSTVHPDTTEGLAKKITAAGAEFGRSPL